jgi:hypothetical protein
MTAKTALSRCAAIALACVLQATIAHAQNSPQTKGGSDAGGTATQRPLVPSDPQRAQPPSPNEDAPPNAESESTPFEGCPDSGRKLQLVV